MRGSKVIKTNASLGIRRARELRMRLDTNLRLRSQMRALFLAVMSKSLNLTVKKNKLK